MSDREEITGFLTSRRARITPEQAGLPLYAGRRRVPGLRREEVAQLAGVSTDYYAKLERGSTPGASREVLEAIARALQLDDTETQHLMDLVQVIPAAPRRRRSRRRTAASLRNAGGARRARGPGARAEPAARHRPRRTAWAQHCTGLSPTDLDDFNGARFTFLDASADDFYIDPTQVKRDVVALLHQAAGRDPYDEETGPPRRSALDPQCGVPRVCGHLTMSSVSSAARSTTGTRWSASSSSGYESFELTTDPGLTMLVYTIEPQSITAERVALLVSWETTPDAARLARDIVIHDLIGGPNERLPDPEQRRPSAFDGFGVFQSAPEETTSAVESALAAAIAHIDTAAGSATSGRS